ncbi:MAG: hypothetical protein IKR23_04145 [Lachnospiraceae bacterium]|nr:hypothetical protein [Lachnospiraceae bacterium]
MACFTATVAEAVVVKVIEKVEEKKELKVAEGSKHVEESARIPFSRKLKWLTSLLIGGSFLLAFEHVWHGEVVPWFPFLTAMNNPDDAAEMFHEIATVGVCMAVLVTLVWVGMCIAADAIVKRSAQETEQDHAA